MLKCILIESKLFRVTGAQMFARPFGRNKCCGKASNKLISIDAVSHTLKPNVKCMRDIQDDLNASVLCCCCCCINRGSTVVYIIYLCSFQNFRSAAKMLHNLFPHISFPKSIKIESVKNAAEKCQLEFLWRSITQTETRCSTIHFRNCFCG